MKLSFYPRLDLPPGMRPAVSLGNFDGLHLGHQRIVRTLIERARALRSPAVALTFEPHPIQVLRPELAPKRILTPEQKQELLAAAGIDLLLIIAFTLEFSQKEPETFVREVLLDKLRAAEVVLGGNFRFGHERAGDLETLRALGQRWGFKVHEIEPVRYRDGLISSSRIRAALADGKVAEAAGMLGRAYFVDGRVVKGDGRGRALGFPTANLELTGDLLVGDGVYVTSARLGGRGYPAMSHVGKRPTFGIDTRAVEAHLFDFSGELYGASLRLEFHDRLRATVTFESAEALGRQLAEDRERALAFFRDSAGKFVL